MKHNYSRFVKRIAIKAPVAGIYHLWATQAGEESWFVRYSPFTTPDGILRSPEQYAQVNDKYVWRWHGWPDDAMEQGTITEANGSNRFAFTFGKAGDVRVNITEDGAYSICELIQENIPTDEETKWNFFIGCQTGWTFYLTNMKSILEGGIDLRNKVPEHTGMLNS